MKRVWDENLIEDARVVYDLQLKKMPSLQMSALRLALTEIQKVHPYIIKIDLHQGESDSKKFMVFTK